jgi:S1-C subfamily serine protease
LKEFLSQKGVDFKEYDISDNPVAASELARRSGQMGVPVTFIDSEMVIGFDRPRLEQALAKMPKSERPSFGASIADASRVTAQQGRGITLGAYIGSIRPGSIAETIGLKVGDIVTDINGQRIMRANDMEMALARLQKGSRLNVTFSRGNEIIRAEGSF